jgi:hypothetical protein
VAQAHLRAMPSFRQIDSSSDDDHDDDKRKRLTLPLSPVVKQLRRLFTPKASWRTDKRGRGGFSVLLMRPTECLLLGILVLMVTISMLVQQRMPRWQQQESRELSWMWLPPPDAVQRPHRKPRPQAIHTRVVSTDSLNPDKKPVKKDKPPVDSQPTKVVDPEFFGQDVKKASSVTDKKKPETKPSSSSVPKIAWLASYPNSGTSYTITLVEGITQRAIASNYGVEVTEKNEASIPIDPKYPEGPFWKGPKIHYPHNYFRNSTRKHNKTATPTVEQLPENYVITKTHCGGRCVKCPLAEYVANATTFLAACLRSTAKTGKHSKMHVEERMYAPKRVHKLIRLIRNPFDNVVARFHLERRHYIEKNSKKYSKLFPNNATGFRHWCRLLDTTYDADVFNATADSWFHDHHASSSATPHASGLSWNVLQLMRDTPCHAEFYKFAQWHNLLTEIHPYLGEHGDENFKKLTRKKTASTTNVEALPKVPLYNLHYEDYETKFPTTVDQLVQFLELSADESRGPRREFRPLPDYSDHFSPHDRGAARRLVKAVATPQTWELVQHYFPTSDVQVKLRRKN